MFFWNSLAFSIIQQKLSIWSLVLLPFLKPAWTSGCSQFMFCWSMVWRILNITLLMCELSPIVRWFEHSLALPFLDWNENWSFPVLWPMLNFPNLLAILNYPRPRRPESLFYWPKVNILILRFLRAYVINFTMEINNFLFRMLTLIHQGVLKVSFHKTWRVYYVIFMWFYVMPPLKIFFLLVSLSTSAFIPESHEEFLRVWNSPY